MKKFLSILLLLISVIGAFTFGGCSKNQKIMGEFYSLEYAYNSELLNVADLTRIAAIYNGEVECIDTLDEQTKLLIKKCIVDELRNKQNIAEAKVEDTEIVKFYGKYSDCFIVTTSNIYLGYNTDVVDEWFYIGGIAFHKTDHLAMQAWVKKI